MKDIRKRLAVGAATGVLAVGLIAPAVAQGTGDTATEDATSEDATDEEVGPVRPDREERKAAFAAALAEELGLDEDEVAAAIDSVRDDMQAERRAAVLERVQARLDEAVAAGELSQAHADAIAAALADGVELPHVHRGETLEEVLADAVALGDLTQEQADAFAAAAEAGLRVGVSGGPGRGGHGPRGGSRGPSGPADDAEVDPTSAQA